MKRIRIHPAHVGLFFVIVICLLLGYFCAHANAEENTTWGQLRAELSGREPDRVSVEQLSAAMSGAMLQHPENAMPLFTTCMIIACNSKQQPKRAAVFVLYTATLTVPEIADEFIEYARKICPQSKAADKVVLPVKEEDFETPYNFQGITPPPDIFSAVTPIVDGKH